MDFEIDLIIESIPQILSGIGITFQLLFISAILGFILAVMLLLMRISGRWYLSWAAQTYIYIFRGTPILVQIFIIYYGLPQFEWLRDSFMWQILREPYGCAIIALTFNSAAYVSEILRGGLKGVDDGMLEAGAALGLSPSQRFIHIIAPIGFRLSIPAYSNDFVSLMKSTSLASTITLMDMMGIGRTIVAETYAPYEIFISMAVIYLTFTWFIQKAFGRLETYMSRYLKK